MSVRTGETGVAPVQRWEQGERKPSRAALRLLQVLAERPDAVCGVAGLNA